MKERRAINIYVSNYEPELKMALLNFLSRTEGIFKLYS